MAWKCHQTTRGSETLAPRRFAPQPASKKVLDAVAAAPLVYRAVVDNDWVRILSVKYTKEAVPPHTHPDRVVYDLATGAVGFEKAGVHEVEGGALHPPSELLVELGNRGGSPRPEGDEPVATYPRLFKPLLDEAHIRVLRVKFGKGTSRPVALGDHVLLSRDKGTLVVTPKGGAARTLDLEPGEVDFFPAGVYAATNPKKESFEVVLFELEP